MTELFCAQPFEHLEVQTNGQAYVCCPGWLPEPIGNVREQDPAKLWNGEAAQRIRASILDGSFRYCTSCPFLGIRQGPVRPMQAVTDPEHLAIIRERRLHVDRVKLLNLAYDRSCNLSCPSCRTEVVVASGQALRRLTTFQASLVTPQLLRSLDSLYITGSGDPFASSLFRDLLRSIDASDYPQLHIILHTNALLFTEENWRAMKRAHPLMHTLLVSIDAATSETYSVNRRGGVWERLLERLHFVKTLRREGPFRNFSLNFVVQANNWREMPEFVRLAHRYDADAAIFTPLRNWGTYSDSEFSNRAVHLSSHPENAQFLQMLKDDPDLHDERAIVTDFTQPRAQAERDWDNPSSADVG
jgi:MoaA/NifB/PqqE/SkfB family radical SAM enzyme